MAKDGHRLWVVKWKDAHGIKDENNREDTLKAHRSAIYYTSGTLVHSDAVGVTITQDVGIPLAEDEETTFRTRTFIPRELVLEERDAGALIKAPKVKHEKAKEVPQGRGDSAS